MSLPKAIFGDPNKPLMLGNFELPCYVLEDGRRLLARGGMIKTLGMSQGTGSKKIGGDRITKFIGGKGIKPFVSDELEAVIKNPIQFTPTSGGTAYGYEATILVEICEAILKASDENLLHYQQKHIAKVASIIIRSLAKVGIIALVDEVTGYQEIRSREALQKILDKYLLKEYLKWSKRFPDDFYKEMFRLKNWSWKGMQVNRPSVVGKYTNDLVYERLAPGILKELRERNPINVETGRRKAKFQQFLTEDIGHPALSQHLHAIIGLMRAASTWDQFHRMTERAFPKLGETIPLALED